MSLSIKNSNVSALFGSLNNNSSSSFDVSGMLSEYASIKNGSYAKLAKQYYSKDSSSKTSPLTSNKDIANQFSDAKKLDIKDNKEMISGAGSLRSSISALSSDDALFTNKITVKDDKGNSSESLDYDKIYKKVSSFVNNYNSMIESGGDSDDTTVLRNTLNMTNAVQRNSSALSKAGITVNADNTLSVSKDSIKEGDMGALKSLFGTTSSFARSIDTYATNIASQSAQNVYSLGGYNSTGAYKQALESIYNTTV